MMPIMAQDAVEEKPQAADQAETVAPAAKEEAKDAKNEAAKEEVVEDASDPFSGLSRRISLDLRSMDIMDTVKFLSKQGNLNIVATKNVNGKVTLFLKDVTISDVLDMILLTNSLACEKKARDNYPDDGKRIRSAFTGRSIPTRKKPRLYPLKYARPQKGWERYWGI